MIDSLQVHFPLPIIRDESLFQQLTTADMEIHVGLPSSIGSSTSSHVSLKVFVASHQYFSISIQLEKCPHPTSALLGSKRIEPHQIELSRWSDLLGILVHN